MKRKVGKKQPLVAACGSKTTDAGGLRKKVKTKIGDIGKTGEKKECEEQRQGCEKLEEEEEDRWSFNNLKDVKEIRGGCCAEWSNKRR